MGKLGISIYPDKCKLEDDKKYLDLAHKYGFKRVFTSLLQIVGDTDTVIQQFKEVISYGNSLGMEVMLDVNPRLSASLGINYADPTFFSDLGVYGIRFDMGFDTTQEALLTRNEYNLKVEINMSGIDSHLESILYRSPKRENLLGSFNFYPQRYTGLEFEHFIESAKIFKKYNLNVAAFVNSQVSTIGPWPIQEGICSLEIHRDLPIGTQIRHLLMTELVDDIIIGNAYASEAELKEASDAFNEKFPTLRVDFVNEITDNERDSVLNINHVYRGDYSGYMIRSAWSRFLVKEKSFPVKNTVQITPGDILVLNDDYGQYKGELQIALREMNNIGRVNVVGHIAKEDMILLPHIKIASDFKLIENK